MDGHNSRKRIAKDEIEHNIKRAYYPNKYLCALTHKMKLKEKDNKYSKRTLISVTI